MSDLTHSTSAPLSALLSVTAIGNGTIWCATTTSPALPDPEKNSSACSSPSVSSSKPATVASIKGPEYVDPGAFSDSDFEEEKHASPHTTEKAKKLDAGARSFVPGKATYGQ